MQPASPCSVRCAVVATRLAAEELLPADEEALKSITALAEHYLPNPCTDPQIRCVLLNISHDHHTVEALRSSGHYGHIQAWTAWFGQVRAILRHAGLDWARDEAVDQEDLAQIAVLELARSLPGYRYASRFSTWAYQVITRGVQRHLRDLTAKKRSGLVVREADPCTLPVPIAEIDLPESRACARAFEALVEAELTAALGVRSARIFRLWVCEDLSAQAIGSCLGLSQARVYAIIAQARQHLSVQEPILCWREAGLG